MNKLQRVDYLFVYMLILSLVFFVGGFYLGGSVVKGKYETKIETIISDFEHKDDAIKMKYLQTDFVTFYYGVLEPFMQLKEDHFKLIDHFNKQDLNYDYPAKTKELLEMSKVTLKKIKETTLNTSSPLLIESKDQLTEAIGYYQKGIRGLINNQSQPNEITLFNQKWLEAQTKFYQAVLEWEKIYEGNEDASILSNENGFEVLTLNNWASLSLHSKDYIISKLMSNKLIAKNYRPEDITIHIDALVRAGSAEQLGINHIGKAIEVLNATNSVHTGDFLKEKEMFYTNVKTPLIPIFLKP